MLCVLVYMWLRPVPDVLVGARYMPLVNTGVKPLCGRNWRVAETFVVYVLCRNTDDRQMLAKNFYGGLGTRNEGADRSAWLHRHVRRAGVVLPRASGVARSISEKIVHLGGLWLPAIFIM